MLGQSELDLGLVLEEPHHLRARLKVAVQHLDAQVITNDTLDVFTCRAFGFGNAGGALMVVAWNPDATTGMAVVPPNRFVFSTTSTFRPLRAAVTAAVSPAAPEPTTIASQSVLIEPLQQQSPRSRAVFHMLRYPTRALPHLPSGRRRSAA